MRLSYGTQNKLLTYLLSYLYT